MTTSSRTYTALFDSECPICFGDIWEGVDEYGWVDDEAVCETCWRDAKEEDD